MACHPPLSPYFVQDVRLVCMRGDGTGACVENCHHTGAPLQTIIRPGCEPIFGEGETDASGFWTPWVESMKPPWIQL
jgi:hypothetical protein